MMVMREQIKLIETHTLHESERPMEMSIIITWRLVEELMGYQ